MLEDLDLGQARRAQVRVVSRPGQRLSAGSGRPERGQSRGRRRCSDKFRNQSGRLVPVVPVLRQHSDYHQAAVSLTVVGYLRPADAAGATAARRSVRCASRRRRPRRSTTRDCHAGLRLVQRDRARGIRLPGVLPVGARAQGPERGSSGPEPTFHLWSLLGDLQVMENHFDEAYKAFDECVKLDPGRAASVPDAGILRSWN